MSNQHIFTYHHDPGHGWLQVPVKLITQLKLDDDITGYSYMGCHLPDLHWGAHNVYLEEDLDMFTFINAYEKAFNQTPRIENKHYKGSAPINNYPSYQSYFRHRLQLYIDYLDTTQTIDNSHLILKRLYDDFGKERTTNALNHLLEEDTTS